MQKEIRETGDHRHGTIVTFDSTVRASADNMLRYHKAYFRYNII